MTSWLSRRGTTTRCGTVATIGTAELLTLIASFEDTRSGRERLSCELAAGHSDLHVALVATVHGGDQWWWLRWDSQPAEALEVIQIDPCAAELPHGQYADDCVLPEGHPGPHSFDLSSPPPLPGEHHRVGLRSNPP